MKKLCLAMFLALFAFAPSMRAAGPDDQYVQIYTLIQQGDALSAGLPSQALAKYREAQAELERFQKVYPTWNNQIVNFRLNYLASQIAAVSAKNPAQNATVAPAVSAPSTANTRAAAPVSPRVPPPAPAPANDLSAQLNSLRAELKQLQSDNQNLQAKLREAFSAQPAAADPAELAKANDRVQSLLKENAALKSNLAQERNKPAPAPVTVADTNALAALNKELATAKQQLAEQTTRANELATENQSLQARVKSLSAEAEAAAALRAENQMLKKLAESKTAAPDGTNALFAARAQIAALESEKEMLRLEKTALQNRVKELSQAPVARSVIPPWNDDSARVKQLTKERDALQKKLEAAQKELYGRRGKAVAARVDELTSELGLLRSRLEVYEAQKVPYTTQELALFKKPQPVVAVADPNAGKKPASELPPGTVALAAQAQRDFSERKFDDAEQKYLEVLRRDNRNVTTLANLATIQIEAGHLQEAEKHLKEALAIEPDDAYSLSILGNLKYREGKYDDALDALSRAAKLDPQNAEVQNYLGLTLSQKGLRAPAETALRKAIQLQPNYGSAHNNLAVIYATQNPPLIELARWHYQRALDSGFPKNPDLEKLLDQKKAAETNQ